MSSRPGARPARFVLAPGPARLSGSLVGPVRDVAVAAVTKNLADELGPHGVDVTVVHPGTTVTERTPSALADRAAAAGRRQQWHDPLLRSFQPATVLRRPPG